MLPGFGTSSLYFPDAIKTCYSTSTCHALRNQPNANRGRREYIKIDVLVGLETAVVQTQR